MLRDVPFENIREENIIFLIENSTTEDLYIEFKSETYGTNDEAKRELLADVSAFANAQGGDLLLGVGAEAGQANALPGIGMIDADKEILRLESIIRDGLEPRVAGIRSRALRLASGEQIIVIRIPASMIAPHRSVASKGGRFYRRNSAGKYEMDIQELRETFTGGEHLADRLTGIHEIAVAAAKGRNMPFSIGTLPAAVLSLTPLDYFRQTRDVELDEFNSQQPYLRRPSPTSWMTTLEGTLIHGLPTENGVSMVEGYAHTHRSGRIEAAWRLGGPSQTSSESEARLVFANYFEGGLCDQAMTAANRLTQMGISGPWVVAVTILNIRGYDLQRDHFNGTTAYRDEAALPSLRLERISAETLTPIFNTFWRLFGHKRPNR
ncbi:RNA-binding domain-containing protein [Gluconacetobacter asukensis]|uniref:ATP-binding protein n=1 Tax=Gluconacetobacter asukensis TaxID=1017181 RepID=A0A7W4J221_9PROT|nr:ATP-binding protein [Gluconacetobacter asukensis]